jgi:type I restriction enzyme, S subunit
MAWEGAIAVVPPECNGLYVSPEYPVFEIDHGAVLPEVLDVIVRSPSFWETLSEASTGTNIRRRRLHPTAFLRIEAPIPTKRVQEQVRAGRMLANRISGAHTETSSTLNALMPSILDRAFAGEL